MHNQNEVGGTQEALPWQRVLRQGLLPQWSRSQVEHLLDKVQSDSPMLLQGKTVEPFPTAACNDWPAEAACPIATTGWMFMETTGEVEEYFAMCAARCDELCGEPASIRHFLNWFDEAPRQEALEGLAKELAAWLGQLPQG